MYNTTINRNMALSWSTTPTPLGYNCYTQRRNRPLKANKHTHRAQHTSRGNRRCGCIITAAVALTTAAVYNKYPEVHMSKHSPRIDDPTASTTPRAPRHHLSSSSARRWVCQRDSEGFLSTPRQHWHFSLHTLDNQNTPFTGNLSL